ncbi:hypothetical protein DY000_02018928 [Brassica cretica]|uniref:Uncharacterized protein n=1 Tax=Brassica cretica TaxID=69181 RepID=A0ABQ7D4C1_BRACR|nr:hypothetical protein DY000_02018928 [Brassica cretica]
MAIYDRHATIPLPESLIALGPEPLEKGIFLYRARRFRDRFGWDDVEETRRKNCRSGPPVQGAQVTRTEATMERPEGDLFCRRNHHRGDNQFCVVHYLIRPAEDDGGADEDVVDEADEDGDVDEVDEDGGVDEAAEDGGEEDSTSSSDSDDVDGDPDYDPGLDESLFSDVHLEQLDHSIHSLSYLEALARGLVSKGNASGVVMLIDEKFVFKMAHSAPWRIARHGAIWRSP